MNFLILAIAHGWQLVARQGDNPTVREAKHRLEAILSQLIPNRDVDLICEESDPIRLSIAQKMAFERKPRMPWKNIMMTSQERLEAGIWQAVTDRPLDVTLEADGVRTVEHRIPEDDTIEKYFAEKSIEAATALSVKSILILCGDLHVDFVAQKLVDRKYHVEVNRDLIPEKYWR